MSDAAVQLELVRKALTSGLSNCVEWLNDKARDRVANNADNRGLKPSEVREFLIAFVRGGGVIEQRREEREQYKFRREYWYRVVMPVTGLKRGLFVELELFDDDPDVPVVLLLNAHPQDR